MLSAAVVIGALRVKTLNNKVNLKTPEMKYAVKFAEGLDPDEAVPNELPHLDLHYLLSNLQWLSII